jgi:hypothetical protein
VGARLNIGAPRLLEGDMKPCNCIDEVDEKLEKLTGCRLDRVITLHGRVTVKILTYRTDRRRKKPVPVFPQYCPFCGRKLEVPK